MFGQRHVDLVHAGSGPEHGGLGHEVRVGGVDGEEDVEAEAAGDGTPCGGRRRRWGSVSSGRRRGRGREGVEVLMVKCLLIVLALVLVFFPFYRMSRANPMDLGRFEVWSR